MHAMIHELMDLLIRWTHVIAGIMWIGNSMLFNWLDRNLQPLEQPKEGVQGKIWLLHSGAFYEVEKKLLPAGQPYPDKVHWFMFQNLTTWLSGIGLLIIVYYMGGAAMLVDPSKTSIDQPTAVLIGVAVLVGSWFVYDGLWRSPLRDQPIASFTVAIVLLTALSYGLSQIFTGRAAYIHIGAMLGSLMTGNVWFYIVPSQRALVAATKAGQPQDPELSYKAKLRSIHNNYMTFPVLFVMVSNHFPSTYGHQLNWVLLMVLMVGSAVVRHFMNIRFTYRNWLIGALGAGVTAVAVVIGIWAVPRATPNIANAAPVEFTTVQTIINQRCVTCHAGTPTDDVFTAAPAGIRLDSPEAIMSLIDRIQARVVDTETMPLGNKTGMTDEERALIAVWIAQQKAGR